MATPDQTVAEHRFGPFAYDPVRRLLFRAGEPVPLVPKLTDTLHVLLERRGTVVEKGELMRLVWPDAVVEETGLARNISLLRKALGDESEQYIQTVPKRGYRFAALPEPAAEPPPPRAGSRPKALFAAVAAAAALVVVYWQFFMPGRLMPGGSRPEIAVLPFEALAPVGSEVRQSFHESLVTTLAATPAVRVVSPGTVRRYEVARIPPHIMARILGIDAVIEGTLEGARSSVRVTARLVDVHSGRIIWASRYDGDADSLANRIVVDVQPHLAAATR